MQKLLALGWNTTLDKRITDKERLNLARITTAGQNTFQGITVLGPCCLKLAGKLSHSINQKFDLPTVGDWVITDNDQQVIKRILPRYSCFVRNVAGNQDQRQVIATNLDELWLVTSLNDEFNISRLNRYILNTWDSGALPVIILTKADLLTNQEPIIKAIQEAHPEIEIISCSAFNGQGLATLRARLTNYRTVALVGSSGVGKSTLINQLIGQSKQATASIREDDSRGRHTTTARHLLSVNQAWLIDTPGMREFGVWANSEQLDQTFDDLLTLTKSCRFNNCQHQTEPGCAVKQALAEGQLAPQRLRDYQKLQRELAYLDKRTRESKLKQGKPY